MSPRYLILLFALPVLLFFGYTKFFVEPIVASSARSWQSPAQSVQQPNGSFEQLFNAAQAYSSRKDYRNAIELYQQVLAQKPDCAPALFNCAQAYAAINDHDKALEYYRRTLEKDSRAPYSLLVPFHKGIAYSAQGDTQHALECFKAVIAVDPNHADAHLYCGKIYDDQKKFDKAFNYYKQAARLNDNYISTLGSLGIEYRDEKEFLKAISCYQEALALDNKNPLFYLHLGDSLNLYARHAKKPEYRKKAAIAYEQARALHESFEACQNLGCLYVEEGNNDRAIERFAKASEIRPEKDNTQMCLGTCYLKKGEFEKGWPGYERRASSHLENPYEKWPRWDGGDLKGKTLLIHAEQGFGDTLQFIRFAKLAKEKGATVIASVQKQLVKLMSASPYIDTVIAMGQPVTQKFDVQIPTMSMPVACKTTLETIPNSVPYIYPNTELVELWKDKLAADKNFKIGICWHVATDHDTTKYKNDSGKVLELPTPLRSIELSELIPLAQMKNVSVYSLQKYEGTEELALLPKNVTVKTFGDDFDKTHGSFMDTAAIMKNLDLIVTVDTAVAHLAGGIGVPVWILLPHVAEWRWLGDNRTDSPWYPTARLFRQPKQGDWNSTIKSVVTSLAPLAQSKTTA